jgi:hypothetical protein
MAKPLSPTQAQILIAAAQHEARLATPPAGLPVAARNAVFRSMLNSGLLEEVAAAESGGSVTLRTTVAGLVAVGAEPSSGERAGEVVTAVQEGGDGKEASTAAQRAHEPPAAVTAAARGRTTLREAATALLVACDAGLESSALPTSKEVLRAALARHENSRTARDPSPPRRPREGTKQQAVLTLLRRDEGARIAQVMEATGWAQHTVRGFLAGLKKKGYTVEVLERVRQVGPGTQGAKGSYSVYRIAEGEPG